MPRGASRLSGAITLPTHIHLTNVYSLIPYSFSFTHSFTHLPQNYSCITLSPVHLFTYSHTY